MNRHEQNDPRKPGRDAEEKARQLAWTQRLLIIIGVLVGGIVYLLVGRLMT